MKLYILLGLLMFVPKFASAVMDPKELPYTVWYSTTVNAVTTSAQVVISSYPAILGSVIINTTGTASKIELWNSKISTAGAAGTYLIASVDTTGWKDNNYNLYLSSGLSIFNTGTTAANVTITYKQK